MYEGKLNRIRDISFDVKDFLRHLRFYTGSSLRGINHRTFKKIISQYFI